MDNILVVGCAAGVWRDLVEVPFKSSYAVIAVNRAIVDYPQRNAMLFGATLHHEMALSFKRDTLRIVSTRMAPGVSFAYDEIPFRHGSSALYAVGLGLLLGGKRIILAGCPLDGGPHYYDEPNHIDVEAYRDPWMRCKGLIQGRVFSMSGWTKELLGPPTL
jgi:hypothetical protein